MSTVTLKKIEYQTLKRKAETYDFIRSAVAGDFFVPPPTKSAGKLINSMHRAKLYNERFLKSVGRGLARSTYFKK